MQFLFILFTGIVQYTVERVQLRWVYEKFKIKMTSMQVET